MITQALQAEDHNAIFNYFGDRVNLKRYHTRLLSLMSKREKLSDLALESLVDSIYNLRCLDPGIFEEALRSLEEREADMIREIMQQADENAEMLQREQEELGNDAINWSKRAILCSLTTGVPADKFCNSNPIKS